MSFDVEVKGVDELIKKLQSLPEKIQKNVVTGSIRAAASMLVKEARLRAPKETGDLAKSIGIKKKRPKDRNIVFFTVAPRYKKKHGALGHLLEFGTSKTPAHPFMRPALEAKATHAINVSKDYMKRRIDRELAKL